MSQDLETTATQSLASPDELRDLLGPPPVLSSEDDLAHNEMVARLAQALAPRDFVEQLLVRELADCTGGDGSLPAPEDADHGARLRRGQAISV